jgi:iron(III) transport system permease protein
MLPLLAGLAMSASPEGREALTAWWARPNGWRVLWHTLAFGASGATVALIAGWIVAPSITSRGAMRTLVLAIACLPLLVPSSLMGVGWIMAMGRDAVITNTLRHVLGDALTPTIYAWPLAAAATGLRYFGVAALVIAWARQDGLTSRAAEQTFRLSWTSRARLRFGATRSAALVARLLLLLLVQSDHILPGLFLVHTFGTEVLIQFSALMDSAGAAALALVPALLSLLVMIVCGMVLSRERPWWAQRDDRPLAPRLHGSAWPMLFAVLALLVAVAVPVTGLVVRAQSVSNLVDAWRGARDEVVHSAWLAGLGAVATLVLAIPLAHAWVASVRARRPSASPLALLNLAVPGSLLALGILALPAPRWLINTNAGLVCGYAARFVAIATIVMFAAWLRHSPASELAARVHGMKTFDRLLRLTLPLRAPATLSALVLVALLVVAELEISLILVRPGPTTLGVRLYTQIHTAPDHVVAALAVDVLIVVMVVAAVFALISAIVGRARVTASVKEGL